MFSLFLDDERIPSDVTWVRLPVTEWMIARSLDDAISLVKQHGFPSTVSFDHDLGLIHYAGDFSDKNTGYDFAKWLIEYDMDTGAMPDNFSFTVHSMNPVGAGNIRQLMNNYLKSKNDK